ncbi:probable serine/threonine-protein kinase DDB_G0276461 isoform X1 [Danaus plexippus]|uniref:probable serine/threonine-protein kinase DDB_G0276461 isoform X1 n=1 Tax=Danaus plexippus TaxID=13037 RepID=UPI002AB0CECB|nr:probable serine/threonine-protein kinase DDB_G0276461 isoform X1 [Danaus plexippus]
MSPVWLVLALLPIIGGAQRFNCRGRILGAYYADAKSGCKAFHVCVRVAGGGIRDFRFFCPPGTLFHQEAQTCTDWGDDDPLACPADIYDGSFDLYKIGSGFDTKKISSSGNREDEAEFGLQRSETGDRRLSQNAPSGGSDLRAAHSSDFFTGQRDRGRDEVVAQTKAPTSIAVTRQSFRRITTTRPPYTSTLFYQTSPSPTTLPPQPSSQPQYEISKRKFLRKRPVYTSTTVPTTVQNTYSPQTYTEPQQNFNRKVPQQNKIFPTTVNIPPQYKEEYVEVSKVVPKQYNNRFFPNNPTPTPFAETTLAPQNTKKDGFGDSFNYDTQSTPANYNENRPFKVRNNFNVQNDVSNEQDFVRIRNYNGNNNGNRAPATSTVDYNSARSTSTPVYKNVNSLSYETEKKNFAPFLGAKQTFYNNPTTTPSTTTIYTTTRADLPPNINTVAYNTNIGFNTQSSNYADSGEDDGQYRPPQGEDDGQYRPELYERESELLSGAHSLNIAASGNRLPEDQKARKTSKAVGKTSPPRPFRPSQTSTLPPSEYTTTYRPQSESSTHRTFDYYQPYTTTSRPYEAPSAVAYTFAPSNPPVKVTTTLAPRTTERSQSRETVPPTTSSLPYSKKSTRPPHYSKAANHREDNSYDYAYYDSDPGFSEYDQIEEFGRTKSRL